jgi:putative IMPACT (imprinted ancient) family translation regulator
MTDTLAAPGRFEIEIRKSRFVAQAIAVDTPDAALAWLASRIVAGASHHCWAFRIGQVHRHNDDGEPAGTAGRPILAAIDGQGYDRVAVVVARWFGGIKLGAGGLVRAYGGAAAECLRRGARQPLVESVVVRLQCDFSHAGTIYARLPALGAERLGETFVAEGLELTLRVPSAMLDTLRRTARDATRGQATICVLPPA